MQQLPISKGKITIISDEDYTQLAQHKWRVYINSGKLYAARWEKGKTMKTRKHIKMHQVIMNPLKGLIVDHIDGDGLNNRRDNLRIVSNRQNTINRRKSVGTSSQFKGVYKAKNTIKWRSYIKTNNRQIYLGMFDTEHQAALVYDLWAKDMFGQYAKLNLG